MVIDMFKIKIIGGLVGVILIILGAVLAIEHHTAAIQHDTANISGAVSASVAEHERLSSDPSKITVPEDN